MVEQDRESQELEEARGVALDYLMQAEVYDTEYNLLAQFDIDAFDTYCLLTEIAKKLCFADIFEGMSKLGRMPDPKRSTLSRMGRLSPVAKLEHKLLTQDYAMRILDGVLDTFAKGDMAPTDAGERIELIQTSIDELFGYYEEVKPNEYQIPEGKMQFWKNVWQQRFQRPETPETFSA